MDSKSPITLLPGDVVGRYRVESFVAEGGMGQVFRAWDASLERHVALKVIRGDHARERPALMRFQREAQILAKLDHPNICRVYDWLEQDGTLVMAMEWVEGTPLSALLDQGVMPLASLMTCLRGIAEGLATAHEKGVIHRDLKPSNIIFTPEGRAKVLDFGLAKSLGGPLAEGDGPEPPDDIDEEASTGVYQDPPTALSQPGAVMGTRGYLAPELLLGESGSARADMYALGVIAAMLLTGETNPRNEGSPLPWGFFP